MDVVMKSHLSGTNQQTKYEFASDIAPTLCNITVRSEQITTNPRQANCIDCLERVYGQG